MNFLRILIAGVLVGSMAGCSSAVTNEPPPAPVEPSPTAAAATTEAPTKVPLPTATSQPDITASSPEPTPLPPTETPATTAEQPAGNPNLDFAQVQFVQATQTGNGTWRFDVTVRHNDQGWDHYADLWQVLDPDGNLLGERVLLHPHDTEQPFTRSQSGIAIPPEVTQVTVRAKCTVHGFGGQEVVVDLATAEGENFSVAAGK